MGKTKIKSKKNTIHTKNTEIKEKVDGQDVKDIFQQLFKSLDLDGDGIINKRIIIDKLVHNGILSDDNRIKKTMQNLNQYSDNEPINLDQFREIIHANITIIEKSLKGNLILPNFDCFSDIIQTLYQNTQSIKEGHVADYIPQLARVCPDYYAISVCTVDGQRLNIGDYERPYCVQSTCKPINYCLALEEHGQQKVHQYIGREPSGRGFNELALNRDNLPHNPMINAGAIMSSSLIRWDLNTSDRFDFILDQWQALCGDVRPWFNNAVYLSEKVTADRNFSLGYMMRENNAFPDEADLLETLDFYFQCCSIEVNSQMQAVVGATLANAGICPTTGKRVLKPETVKNCLSLMYSCGMYDYSGEFAFSIGLPAKSGVSGALMIVIPNVMGITIWAPPLDRQGNSVKGVRFCQSLIDRYNFHNYDNLIQHEEKDDPRLNKNKTKLQGVMALCQAASVGDINEIRQLSSKGVDINEGDYDKRTALHLAASEGQLAVIEYFIEQGVDVNPRDRWNGTPLLDAERENHRDVAVLLKKHGGIK